MRRSETSCSRRVGFSTNLSGSLIIPGKAFFLSTHPPSRTEKQDDCRGIGFRLGDGNDLLVEGSSTKLKCGADEAIGAESTVETNTIKLVAANRSVDIELVRVVASPPTPQRGSCPVVDGEIVDTHGQFAEMDGHAAGAEVDDGIRVEREGSSRAIVGAAEGEAGCGGGAIGRAGEREVFAVDCIVGRDEERAAVDLDCGVAAEGVGMSRIERAGINCRGSGVGV